MTSNIVLHGPSIPLSKEELTERPIHLLPCHIDYSGPADVSSYFTIHDPKHAVDEGSCQLAPLEDVDDNTDDSNVIIKHDTTLTSAFRGRPLSGSHVTLPERIMGVVVNEKTVSLSDAQDREFQITDSFNEFTYWNLDKAPSANDMVNQAVEWFDIAELIHSPVEII